MKKLFLTLAAAATVLGASAVTLPINDASKVTVDGTFTETTYKADGTSVQAYAHWQPITKFECEGYSFAFAGGSTEAAYYDAKAENSWTLRCYVENTVTITAPEGTKMYGLTFAATNATAGKFSATVDNGTLNYDDLSSIKWTNMEGASSVVLSIGGTVRFTSIEVAVTPEEVTEPSTPEDPTTPSDPSEDYTLRLCLNDATEIAGTFVAEQAPSADNQYGAAAHYENLTSFVVGEYYFSTTLTADNKTKPAFYLPMSTSTTGNNNCRIYTGAILNVYAPEKVVKLVFDGSNFASGLTATSEQGNVTVDTSNSSAPKLIWENAEGATDISIAASGNWRFYNVDVTTLNWVTGVETVESVPVVYVNGNSIIAPEGAVVYSVNGVRCGTENLQSGLYVVALGNKAVKVLVK